MDRMISYDSTEARELSAQLKQARLYCKEALSHQRPSINSERYLTAVELMEYLHISPRTLQNLRDKRLICFTILGGKILYPEKQLLAVLKENTLEVEP